MKTIIAGSRNMVDIMRVYEAVEDSGWLGEIDEVVSGAARGADRLGEEWAARMQTRVKRFPADWNKYGKVAGKLRNWEMARYADALIAIWDGMSPGTANMIAAMTALGKPVYVYLTKEEI